MKNHSNTLKQNPKIIFAYFRHLLQPCCLLLDLLLLKPHLLNTPRNKLIRIHGQDNPEPFGIQRHANNLRDLQEGRDKHQNPKNQIAIIMLMKTLPQLAVMDSVRMVMMARMHTEDAEI